VQLQRESAVRVDVVRVVVLVGIPGGRILGQQLSNPLATCLLPAAFGVRLGDLLDLHTVGRQHPGDDRLQSDVGDDGDRVPVHHASQCESQTQCATAGLDDRRPWAKVPTGASALDHVHCGTILDAARVEALELCPESAMIVGEGCGDAQDRGVAHRRGERRGRVMAAQVSVSGCVPVNGMKGDNRGHRMVTSGPGRGVKRGR